MQARSRPLAALAFSSVMIGLYCQFAAIALIFSGSAFAPLGADYASVTLVIGAAFFVLTFAAYFLAYGFWTRKHWSLAGGVALMVAFSVLNVALSMVSGNFLSSLLPVGAAVVCVWYLNRGEIKAQLGGTEPSATAPSAGHDPLTGAQPVR